jgi:hypothetical protein
MNPILWILGLLIAPFWTLMLLFLKVLWWIAESVLIVAFDMSIELFKLLVYLAKEAYKAIQGRRK